MSDTMVDTKDPTLDDLGITYTINEEGNKIFSITAETGIGADTTQRFRLDPATKRWVRPPHEQEKATKDSPISTRDHAPVQKTLTPCWLDKLPDTNHIKLFRDTDWAATSLGPLHLWPISLQTMVNFAMHDHMSVAIYWGPELCGIQNAECTRLLGERLVIQSAMGASLYHLFPDFSAEFASTLENIALTGVAVDIPDIYLYPDVHGTGRKEETCWFGSWLPLRGPDGTVQGFYNRSRETTREVTTERRARALNAIALEPELAGEDVWEHLFNAFRANEREFPMAFAYSTMEDQSAGQHKLRLTQSIGLPEQGHLLVPYTIDLDDGQSGFFPYYRRARSSEQPILLHEHDGTLPDDLVKGFEWKGFGEPSQSVAVISISSSDRLLGLIVVGLNSRRPFDGEYEGFLSSLTRHASATIVHAIDKETGRLRAERLSSQLEESERQIRELAMHGPAGIVRCSPTGKVTWANDQFYELTEHSRKEEDSYDFSFLDVIDLEDQALCISKFFEVINQRQSVNFALRLRRKWRPSSCPDGSGLSEFPVWVTLSARPVLEDNEIKGTAAAVTDISYYKWAEAIQSHNAASAKEAKKMQETFIDLVSHEMRNPLSAITQLADSMSSSLERLQRSADLTNAHRILADNAEEAKTILLCAAHQKRIIDDVLTLSKLDAMMLSITPVVVQPSTVVDAVLKMFESELQSNDIAFEAILDKTYEQNNIDWISIDPSRLAQILVNLLGNAIKFTRDSRTRKISIHSGASLTPPPSIAGVRWFPTDKKRQDPTDSAEWGEGTPIYVYFQVHDTGRGLEQEEMNKLFSRFQQATAKTHIKYGGSGLGLFISRELTETQGGQIGVRSAPGKGSTFAFYIKGKYAAAPEKPPPGLTKTASRTLQTMNHTSNTVTIQPRKRSREESLTVLLVEDNLVNVKVLKRGLEMAGLTVYVANHGQEALDFLAGTKMWTVCAMGDTPKDIDLDCILMDIEMPVMDGLTCTREIRKLEAEGTITKHVNIVAITANVRQEQIDTAMQAGADDVMPKPFRVNDLLQKIDEVRLQHASDP